MEPDPNRRVFTRDCTLAAPAGTKVREGEATKLGATGGKRLPPVTLHAVKGFWKTVGPSCHCIGVLSDAVS